MKIRILQYCQEIIDGYLQILDAKRVIEINDDDANSLIEKGLAESLDEQTCLDNGQVIHYEDKMINFRRRGRPRKEVKNDNV